MENKTRNKGESIAALIFGIIWFAMSVLILVLYNSGESLQELPIPRMLMFFYDVFGVQIGAIVQLIFSGALIVTGKRAY